MKPVVWVALLVLVVAQVQRARAWTGAPACAAESGSEAEPAHGADGNRQTPPVCTPKHAKGGTAPIGPEQPLEALTAYREAKRLMQLGHAEEAALQLRVVEHMSPRIADRIALMRGDLGMRMNQPDQACEAYDLALQSLESTVRVLARVGKVRCSIARGSRKAESDLKKLIARYPKLGQRRRLEFELGMAKEQAGDRMSAGRLYREIDVMEPSSPTAALARERMDRLRSEGVSIRALTLLETIERADRLVRAGSLALAALAIEELRGVNSKEARSAVLSLSQRLALMAGGTSSAPSTTSPASVEETTTVSEETKKALQRINTLGRRGSYRGVPTARLLQIIEIASPHDLKTETDRVLDALLVRKLPPRVRFRAAVQASGVGSDEKVMALLSGIVEDVSVGAGARYHYGRALERMGKWDQAVAQYQQILSQDRSDTRYYAMWAHLRLTQNGASVGAPVLLATIGSVPEMPRADTNPPGYEGMRTLASPSDAAEDEQPDLEQLAEQLSLLVNEYDAVYPWLARSRALLRLGERGAARDELAEAYLAWREAHGRELRFYGLEAICRGDARPRAATNYKIRKARRELSESARKTLANIADALGDTGTAIGFGAYSANDRPRAYASAVYAAARKYGMDPNLLFAIMRVESVYQQKIVSSAGAIGLMQIMPTTGRNIAYRMGYMEFMPADLLNARTNVDFSAWYLSSLIERFNGRLPLAIAAYNGGPHNVRRWLREESDQMPLDAFLEGIPFDQTHRYVRRVLTHYAAYRAQQGLPMETLSVRLPELKPDRVSF